MLKPVLPTLALLTLAYTALAQGTAILHCKPIASTVCSVAAPGPDGAKCTSQPAASRISYWRFDFRQGTLRLCTEGKPCAQPQYSAEWEIRWFAWFGETLARLKMESEQQDTLWAISKDGQSYSETAVSSGRVTTSFGVCTAE